MGIRLRLGAQEGTGELMPVIGKGTFSFCSATRRQSSWGDIIESSDKGFAQLEFVGGAIVALGPLSRMYVFRHGMGGKAGSDATGTELVLLSGWLKGDDESF